MAVLITTAAALHVLAPLLSQEQGSVLYICHMNTPAARPPSLNNFYKYTQRERHASRIKEEATVFMLLLTRWGTVWSTSHRHRGGRDSDQHCT